MINVLERDYNEKISDMSKIGLLVGMVPENFQDAVIQQSNWLKEYRHVKDKVINIVDARARLEDPNAMDIGYAGHEYDEWNDEGDEQFVGAMDMHFTCRRCG